MLSSWPIITQTGARFYARSGTPRMPRKFPAHEQLQVRHRLFWNSQPYDPITRSLDHKQFPVPPSVLILKFTDGNLSWWNRMYSGAIYRIWPKRWSRPILFELKPSHSVPRPARNQQCDSCYVSRCKYSVFTPWRPCRTAPSYCENRPRVQDRRNN